MAVVRIGTSGWHYDSWIGPFYPAGTAKKALLSTYAAQFSTTEINASFYRVPTQQAVRSWAEQVPDDFVFAWKASRYITHFKRLKDVADNVGFVIDRMAPLGRKFGPILWQLPPQLAPDRERLGRFIQTLPRDRLHAIEFRHPGWFEAAVFDLLRDENVALCLSDHAAAPTPWVATADHRYVRPHGPGGRYEGSYPDETLTEWGARLAAWQHEGHPVFCYFDNDQKSAAPFDAQRLEQQVGERLARVR